MLSKLCLALVIPVLATAHPAVARSLPGGVVGSWDVSESSCASPGTSATQIDISGNKIDTFGGDAVVRDVETTGPVTFVAADFVQLEGVPEIGNPERTHFRFTQRQGPNKLNMIWKDVQTVDLVRCDDPVKVE